MGFMSHSHQEVFLQTLNKHSIYIRLYKSINASFTADNSQYFQDVSKKSGLERRKAKSNYSLNGINLFQNFEDHFGFYLRLRLPDQSVCHYNSIFTHGAAIFTPKLPGQNWVTVPPNVKTSCLTPFS